MEQNKDIEKMLGLMPNPVFCAVDHTITHLNQAAAQLFLRTGMPLEPLFESGAQDYSAFDGGMLYVTLSVCGQSRGASIVRIDDMDVFSLDPVFESDSLRVLALAARELRGPLSNAMLASQQLADSENTDEVSRLNRGLYQLLRIISNMSDATGNGIPFRPELRNANALFQEIADKAAAAASSAGVSITYSGLKEEISCLLDAQQLERAALNMISNAIKFSGKDSTVSLTLTRFGTSLRFSVTDHGSGISEELQGTLFHRYLREPAIEDSRHGIGLGMLLIRSAAASHGGAVLIDHPEADQTRVSLTVSTDLQTNTALHTSRLQADYAGENDHTLLELSELLPPTLY